jgi:ribosomal-protein-serine acetyltransferase
MSSLPELASIFKLIELPGGITLAPRKPIASENQEYADLISQNRSMLGQWLPWVHSETGSDSQNAFAVATSEEMQRKESVALAIRANGKAIGMISTHRIQWNTRSVELGYWLGEEHQGQGILTQAASALIERLFRECHLERIEIRMGVGNERSQAMAQRLGFVLEGVRHRAELLNGNWIHHWQYSLTRPEYERFCSPTTILSTSRLRLRDLTPGDSALLSSLLNDREVVGRYYPANFLGMPWFTFLQRALARQRQDQMTFWVVESLQTAESLGLCALLRQETALGRFETEVGYMLLPKHWGKGYASEAALGCMALAKNKFEAKKIISLIHVDNLKSQAVAKRNGLVIRERIQKFDLPIDVWEKPLL